MFTAIFSNENKYEVLETQDQWMLNDKPVRFDCLKVEDNKYHLIFNNQSIYVTLVEFDRNDKSFIFGIDEKEFKLTIEDEFDRLLAQMGMEAGGTIIESSFKAPMPGLVLDILVKPGDVVVKDQPLVILEAMKMENALKSPGEVSIAEVLVSKNDKVEKNQVLIRFA